MKDKKRAREESNGHATKKTKPNEDKSTTKKNKKEPTETATTSNEPSTSAQPPPPKKTNSLETKDLRVGNGPEAKLGKSVRLLIEIFSIEHLCFVFLGCSLLQWSTSK